MSVLLYINGQLIDLEPGNLIAQTKQVNDVANVSSREANYTNRFKVPKTANNVRAMQFMTLPGNTSPVPYQKNECDLKSDNGQQFVYKGRAVVTDAGDAYEVHVQDGITDLFKAIENKNLSELDLSELVHTKDVATVISTWQDTATNYKYILADYNGNTGNVNPEEGNPEVNIDYLVPAVRVSWLWGQLMNFAGATWAGAVFDTIYFQELWMTYPKGVGITGENDHIIFESNDFDFWNPYAASRYAAQYITASVNELAGANQNIHLRPGQAATYRIEITCKLFGKRGTSQAPQQDAMIFLGKNEDGAPSTGQQYIWPWLTLAESIPYGQETTIVSDIFSLESTDSICIIIGNAITQNGYYLPPSGNEFEVKLVRIDPNVVDFSEAFTDFSMTDFVKEIVQRFGLTMFKDKSRNHYEFLTLQEHLQTSQVLDWSDKFSKKISENYIVDYAQRNWFRYNYNDKESTHNDSYLDIANVNLTDSKDVVKSKIYSPERIPVLYFNEESKVYKLWDKEVSETDEGQQVNYKPLDKRYYLMRSIPRSGNITVYSGALGTSVNTNYCFVESFWKLSFFDILQTFYSPMRMILDRSVLVKAELWLNDADVANIDFRKLYYIKQLSNYFILNKIENYIPGRITKCELVKVAYSEAEQLPPPIKITKVVPVNGGMSVNIYFELNLDTDTVTLQVLGGYQSSGWASFPYNAISPRYFDFTPTGNMTIRLLADGIYSNEVPLTIPLNQTIEIP